MIRPCRAGASPLPAPPLAHRRQPKRSHVCGQICVAILAQVTPAAAMAVCSNLRQRKTSEQDLRRGLAALGLELAPFVRVSPRRCLPDVVPGQLAIAPALLVRVRFRWRPHGYHWVVFTRYHVYDPSLPRVVSRFTWLRLVLPRQGYVTSLAPVRAREDAKALFSPHVDNAIAPIARDRG